ncbi:unnamed protein product [Trichobilharzia regenti]|nr:unnamed protein product [Trichobilharzia regenti]
MEFPNTPSLVIPHGSHSSGKWTYCYKPLNKVTCCPSYTIQCDALNFQLKRSHKRVLKNMCDFLKYGKLSNVKIVDNLEPASTPERNDHCEGIPTDEGAGDLRVLSTQSEWRGSEELSNRGVASVEEGQDDRDEDEDKDE